MNFNLKEKHTILMKYTHNEPEESFTVKTMMSSGLVIVSINHYKKSENYLDSVPTPQDRLFTYRSDEQQELEIRPTDENFCYDCVYLIKIYSMRKSQFIFEV
mmetsp:Transcript_2521/g.2150  ORF Transcript_2521/g.2150 Transcript_2521/m.2150 type:complete len:102 (+) Transcript_2521:3536-3841(+)